MPMPNRFGKRARSMKGKKLIKVENLARVEGEGGITVKVKDDKVAEVKLNIFEPPRFFEAFLCGRSYSEVPDITARICGICPFAHMMSSTKAMENGFEVKVDNQIRAVRRLVYYGEWIESHALHVYMLHAPDFFKYQDAVQLAKVYPETVQKGLQLKKTGNMILSFFSGREIHPINNKVGGFYSLPEKKGLAALKDQIKQARDIAYETVKWTSTFQFPDFEQDYEFVALHHPEEYGLLDGRLISNKGLDIEINEFEDYFFEEQVAHSTSLHAYKKGGGVYHVGPMARFNLNFDQLTPIAQEAAKEVGLAPVCYNPFKSIVIRSIEILHACDDSLGLIEEYEKPSRSFIDITPKACLGYGCTEAPRGTCWHYYHVNENGHVKKAKIVPPTSQNQKIIEEDLLYFVQKNLHLNQEALTWLCEQVVRNYDPCISCSCHFLKLNIEYE